MSDIKIILTYNGNNTIIQCNSDDKIKQIIDRLGNKIDDIDINKIYLLYNGKKINVDYKIGDIINDLDKNKKEMNIIINNTDDTTINNKNIKKSKDIICPECKENILIKLEDYKLIMYNCKNNHNKQILLEEYENTQNIDLSKIKCEICNENN